MTYTGIVQNSTLEIAYQNQVRLQVDISDICRRAHIPYNGQAASVIGQNLVIGPAQAGGMSVRIPLDEIVIQYAAQPYAPTFADRLARFNRVSTRCLRRIARKIFFEEVE